MRHGVDTALHTVSVLSALTVLNGPGDQPHPGFRP